ncbi:MAG: hypothetical protein ACLP0J_10245 [Solirubrobacteraceae bacterium]
MATACAVPIGMPLPDAMAAGWAIQPTVLPTELADSEMSSVSCVSSTSCMAVGDVDNGYNSTGTSILDPAALAESWNGTAWDNIQPTADTAGQTTYLDQVSCVSATFCMAVGSTSPAAVPFAPPFEVGGEGGRAPAELWNGTDWTIQPTPSPAGKEGTALTGVSCLTATFCVAVGEGGPDEEGFAEIWNGSDWRLLPTPSTVQVRSLDDRGRASRQRVSLTAVSCVTRAACTAVGSYNSTPGLLQPSYGAVAERWNGRRWNVQQFPPGSNQDQEFDGTLTGVSCASTSSCMAVGYGPPINGSGFFPSLQFADYWNGARWTITPTIGLPKYDDDRRAGPVGPLYGVSCVAPTDCTAVGQRQPGKYTLPGPILDPLVQQWNGRQWTPVATPPAPARITPQGDTIASVLVAVSCVTGGTCTAVGGRGAGDDILPLAESDAPSVPSAVS